MEELSHMEECIVIGVTYTPGGSVYHFKSKMKVQVGDYVIVPNTDSGRGHGAAVCQVSSINLPMLEDDDPWKYKWIIAVVPAAAFRTCQKAILQDEIRILEKKLEAL